jgi:DNA invertase Pin-like site-specific DNA recombinase
VCHRCDNPPCVRPDHLFLGTQRANIEDMRAKGRAARGVNHFRAKLDPDKVREIRSARAAGESPYSIAARIGVSPPTVYAVLGGKTWKHVT